jgi:hypothetical protein
MKDKLSQKTFMHPYQQQQQQQQQRFVLRVISCHRVAMQGGLQ